MKTRREFMRFTLGGLACLGAAVMAPKTLAAIVLKEKTSYLEAYHHGFSEASGYAQIGDVVDSKPIKGTCTITFTAKEGNVPWTQVAPENSLTQLLDPNCVKF